MMENFEILTKATEEYTSHLGYIKSKKYVTISNFISYSGLTKAEGIKILEKVILRGILCTKWLFCRLLYRFVVL